MSAIRGIQVKCNEPYMEYGEEYFAQYNEEVCHLRRSYYTKRDERVGCVL